MGKRDLFHKRGPSFHEIHGFIERPSRGSVAFAEDDLPLGSVAAAELLELVPALDRGFVGGDLRVRGAEVREGLGDLLPVGGPELTTFEGVPDLTVGFDEVDGLDGGPCAWRRLLLLQLLLLLLLLR